ncbi:MAG: hypothetical protein DHS20C15_18090 [Planctomycetota bacterium]|nr:MAG: hypothetical protein DHS20C15_18090 [Planctomycetota bacterium]
MLKPILLLSLLAPIAAATPQQDPAHLVPADTLIYFGTDSVKAGSVAARKTAMARVFEEAEVRAFLHEPVAAAEGILKVILGQAAAEAAGGMFGGQLEGDLGISLYPGASAEPMPVGRALFALTHVELGPVPDVGLLVALDLLDEEHVEMLRGVWSQVPGAPQQGDYKGVEVHAKFLGEGAPSPSLAFVDGMAVLTTSPRSLHAFIDRAKGEGAGSLAETADYKSMLTAAGARASGSSAMMVRVPALAGLVKVGLNIGLAQAQMSGEMPAEDAARILALFDRLGLDAIELIGSVSSIADNGRIHSTNVVRVNESATGLVSAMAAGGGLIDPSVFGTIPADCLSASASGIGTELVQMFDFIMETGRSFAPEEFAGVEGMIAGALGGRSLRDDILANMQDQVVSMTVPGTGFPGTPNSIVSVGMARPDDFVAAVSNLIAFASTMLDDSGAGMSVSLKEGEHAGTSFFELDLSQTPLAAMGVSPALSVRDGRITFSDNSGRLRGFLDGGMNDGPRLGSDPRFKAFAGALAMEGDLVTLSYSDTPSNFSTMYAQVSGFAPMLPMMMGSVQLPIDFSKLPREKSITQHLDIALAGGYRTESGMFVQRSESSFSALEMLPLLAVAGLIGFGQAEGIEPVIEAPEVDPADVARGDLRELKASMTVYKIGTGDYPSSLDELVRPLEDFPEGAYTASDTLPSDPWGGAYRFSMEPSPSRSGRIMPKLWSMGPNGIDESGEGDDVVESGWR